MQGTPYEMGYALGQMFGPQIEANMQSMVGYANDEWTKFTTKYISWPAF